MKDNIPFEEARWHVPVSDRMCTREGILDVMTELGHILFDAEALHADLTYAVRQVFSQPSAR